MTLTVPSADRAAAPPRPGTRALALPTVRWAAAAAVAFVAASLLQFAGAPSWLWGVSYVACYLAGGWAPGLAGLRVFRLGSCGPWALVAL